MIYVSVNKRESIYIYIKEITMFMHKTKDGREIPLNKIEDQHLINIIAYIKKKAHAGITINRFAGDGDLGFEPYYDEDTIYGKEAEDYLNLKKYRKELKRRGVTLLGSRERRE